MFPEVVADFGDGNLPCRPLDIESQPVFHHGILTHPSSCPSCLTVGQLLLEIHAERTEHPYATDEFGAWWQMLEDAGLRAFWSEINYPASTLVSFFFALGRPVGAGD